MLTDDAHLISKKLILPGLGRQREPRQLVLQHASVDQFYSFWEFLQGKPF